MIDVKLIRENPSLVKENLKKRHIPKVPEENKTPIQKEFTAMSAEKVEEIFAEVKNMKRQFPQGIIHQNNRQLWNNHVIRNLKEEHYKTK